MNTGNKDLVPIIGMIEDLKKQIEKSGDDFSLEMKTKMGQQLDALTKISTEALTAIRNRLREDATRVWRGGAGVYQLNADCYVKFPYPVKTLKNTADIDFLKRVLGDDFGDVITINTRYELRKEIPEEILKKYLNILSNVIDVVDGGTPRVFFKKEE
jgi:hypothetical protein